MSVSRAAHLWRLSVFVALSAASCNAIDHPVGAAAQDELLGAAGADNADRSTSTTSGDDNGAHGGDTWGELPIPNSCTPVRSVNDAAVCELDVACGDVPVSTRCFAFDDFFECECPGILGNIELELTGISISDACSHTLAACMNWPLLEFGPLDCSPTNEADDAEFCLYDGPCAVEAVVGQAHVTAKYELQSDCGGGSAGWSCGCGSPNGGRFKVTTPTSDPQCLDLRGWCAGVDVEPIGSRTCSLTSQYEAEDTCYADVECERAATLSGQEGTMYEDEQVDCYFSSTGRYQCRCSSTLPHTEVAAEDLRSACTTAVSLCDGDGGVPIE